MNLGRKAQEEQPKPSKLERLQGLADRLTTERAAVDIKVPELQQQEHELRREGVRKDPDRRSDWQGARAEATQKKREWETLVASVPALDAELAAVAVEIQAELNQLAQATFEEALAGVAEYDDRERALIDLLAQARAAFYEQFEAWKTVCAERRAYAGQFTFATQGMVNQIQAAVEPKWNPPTPVDAFDRLTIEAGKAAEPVVDVRSSFNLDLVQPSEAELSSHYTRIAVARNAGITTQELPPQPGAAPEPETEPELEPGPELVGVGVANEGSKEAAARRHDAYEAAKHQRDLN